MRKHTERLLAQAKTAREWGNEDIAQKLTWKAEDFEARKPQVIKYVRLASEAGANIMAQRIAAKLDDCEYGQAVEPGYDSDVWRVFYNWNNAPKLLKAVERLRKLGCPIEAEWGDEWCACDVCGRYVRTSPTSYSWMRSYAEINYEIVCHECIKGDPELYIEWLTGTNDLNHNPPAHANTILDNQTLEAAGFRQFADGLENGLHEFQAASPAKIARWLRERGINEYLFSIDDQGQFDTTFSVWIKSDKELEPPTNASEWDDSPSPAEIAKAMLRSIANA
jgi:hypothetical protein